MIAVPDNLLHRVLLARRAFIIQAVVSRKPLMPILWIVFAIPDYLTHRVLLARRVFIIQAVVSRKPLVPILRMVLLLLVVFLIFLYHFRSNLRRFLDSLYHSIFEVFQQTFFCPRNLVHRVLLVRRVFIIHRVLLAVWMMMMFLVFWIILPYATRTNYVTCGGWQRSQKTFACSRNLLL